ncbi:hypothetical protein [Rhodococcus phenolicus]|uniref:hypothetical protein n=1 Tax=Rhodococcus phenolicus TaxID=263849 RepID=UPI0008335D44|nr:hypothetical protein [Rhodococcus phenolicus]
MSIHAVTASAPTGDDRVYGAPYETSDGTTIVTVTGFHRAWFRRGAVQPVPKPIGVFVVRDGEVRWVAAVDETRIALMGELIGLVAATIATLAVLRRPPWPDLSIR